MIRTHQKALILESAMALQILDSGSIKKRLFIVSALLVAIPILCITLILYFSLNAKSKEDFMARANGEVAQVDNAMAIMIDGAMQNLELMGVHPALQQLDESLTNYTERTGATDLKTLERSPLEATLFEHFSLIAKTHPDYLELYLGSKFGGMVTSDLGSLRAGYDPRQRPWYKDAEAGRGQSVVAKAYLSTLGDYVTAVTKAYPDASGGTAYAVGIDISLKRLSEIFNTIRIGKTGYLVLIESDGTVLAHPTLKELVSKNIDSLNIPALSEGVKTNSPAFEYTINGISKVGLVKTASRGGWKILAVIDEDEILASAKALMAKIILIGVVFIALALALSYALSSRITAGIRRIHDVMEEIASGGGDLTRRIHIDGNDEVAQTAAAFNRFLEQLQRMFSEIIGESARLLGGVRSVSDVLQEISEDSRNLSDLTASNAAAIEEITVSISHIAANAADADSLVKDTGSISSESAQTVAEIASEVGKSADEVKKIAELLGLLNKRSDEIGGITNVIKEIADQTNLLALNAAIEAARAGEQGRGFAVVADEVRKLAERTASATLQISGMVDGIRNETRSAVLSMNSTLEIVTAGASHSAEAAENIGRIQQNMDGVLRKMEDIANATREEQSATTSMAQSAEGITSKMQKSDADLQEAAQTLTQLNDMAQKLQAMFRNFKV
jgi:methyl-accepting chemotaxis protein